MAKAEVNGTENKVIDIITDDQIVTWEELSEVKVATKYLAKYQKYIRYRTSIPLDKMAEITAKVPGNSSQATFNRIVEMLKYILVQPAVSSPESVRALAKADWSVFNEIITEAVGKQEADEFEQSLGEDLPSSS